MLKQAQALFNDNFPAILQAQLATVKGACMKSLFELFASRCASPEFFCYVLDSMLDILLREQSTKKPATGDKDTTVQFLESALRGSLTSRLKHAYFAYPQSSEASVQLMGQHLKFLQEAVECLSDAPQKLEALKAKLVYSITDIERLLALRKAKASKRKKKQFPEGADALEEPAEPAKKPAEEENRYLWLKDVNFLSFTALLADAILQTLYGIEFLELSTKACLVTAQTYNNVHFCRLPQSVYETLMEERLRYRILLPFVQPPQPFRTAGPGRIAGGYCTTGRREVLFNFQPFLKSFVGHSFLSTVNKLQQRNAFAINTTFLYYLMDLTVQQLGDCTELGLAFQEYVRRRITKSSTRQAGSATIDLLPVFEYLSTMFLAELYSRRSNLGFYFLYFLDRRCRLYLRAYPLSFFATRHLRPLFVQAHTSSPALSFEARARLFEQEVLGFFSRSEWAAKAGFLLDPSRSLAGLDASSQLYQLLGGLLGDRRLLTLTYVLPLEELVIGPRTADESLGLYEYLLLKFKEHLDSSGGSALLEKELRGLQQIIDASSDRSELHLNPADWGVDALLEKADRPWVKSTLMTYGYNKSTLEIIKDSFSHFFPEPEIRKNLNY